MGDQLQVLQQTVDRLVRQVSDLSGEGGGATTLGADSPGGFDPLPVPSPAPTPPASNSIRSGDFSHSTGSWWEAVVAANDEFLEAAHWYSHDPYSIGQALSFVDARTSSVNQALKLTTHTEYDSAYCDWSVPAGVARFQGLKTLDAPFPANSVFPGRPMYMGAIIARRNSTIVIQDDNRISAMLYDNTVGSEDVMQSGIAFAVTAQVRGTPGTTTELRYKVLAETDRGLSYLSDEATLGAGVGPSNAAFTSGVDVYLAWPAIAGVLRYKIYRHDITAAKYRLLYTVTSGSNTYGDNNRQDDDDVGGYPSADYDRIVCIAATLDGELSSLAVDGVSLAWSPLFLNIPVPSPLLSVASGAQVLRLFLSRVMDREMTDAVSTASSTTVQAATGEFTALDTGRIATLRNAAGTILHGPEAITFVDATHVTFATAVAASSTGSSLYIVEGGDHGLLIDMVHIGYLSRASYAPYFEDLNRGLPSTAAPNTSGQGGLPPGGDTGDPGDGGISGCVEISCPVAVLLGNTFVEIAAGKVPRGMALKSGNHAPNYVLDLLPSETDNLHIVRTKNGLELPCSPKQRLFTSGLDNRGKAVERLREGDYIATCFDGQDESSPITEIIATGLPAKTTTFRLSPGHRYFAGRLRLPWWKRAVRWLQGKRGICMVAVSNRKTDPEVLP